jgi:hypothetical protein
LLTPVAWEIALNEISGRDGCRQFLAHYGEQIKMPCPLADERF